MGSKVRPGVKLWNSGPIKRKHTKFHDNLIATCALFLLGFFFLMHAFDLWPKVLRSPIGWIYGIHFGFKFNMHRFPKSVWTLARKLKTASATPTLDMSHIAQPIIRLLACANSCVSWTPGTTSSHLCQLMSVICVLAAAVSTHRPATSAWNDVVRSCCHRLHSSAGLPHSQSRCHLMRNVKKRDSSWHPWGHISEPRPRAQ